MKRIVLFDIDGTLANVDHRLHLVREKPKNWPRFFEWGAKDTVNEHVAKALELFYEDGYTVVIMSGRPDTYRTLTEDWLEEHCLQYNELYMRKGKDSRSDDIVKEELFNEHLGARKDQILCVFDDRPKVIRMWRKIGLSVFDCGAGVEF